MRIAVSFALAAIAAGHSSALSVAPKPREVEVTGVDYAFTLPHELPAGRTIFRFRNRGKVAHEFNIVMLKRGVTVDQFIQAGKDDKPQMIMVEGPVGVLFADPGKASAVALSTDLVAGRYYAVQCINRDSATAPRHLAMGMYSVIHVTAGKASSPTRPVKADTIVAVDYAYRYPRTLAPGRHTFMLRNEGKVRHEMNIALLKKGVTLDSALAVDKAGGNVFPLLDNADGLLLSRAGETALGGLEVDMLPGREYEIICFVSDDPKSPPHYKLGMYGSIRVPGKPQA
jgi:hypothetical protein